MEADEGRERPEGDEDHEGDEGHESDEGHEGVDETHVVGVSLDYSACFDRIDPELGISLLQKLGLPDAICAPLRFMYSTMQCTLQRLTLSEPKLA